MVSSEMQGILDLMEAAPRTAGPVAERRAGLEATTGTLSPLTGTEIELVELDRFEAEWIRGPEVGDGAALLYLHGGGYCIGSINTHRALASRLSASSGLPVLLPGYRLAPEHPFPAALDDAVQGYRWLVDRGVPPTRLVVAGDSAGGGLALAATLKIRDDDPDLLPAAVALLSPWTDLTGSGASMTANAGIDPVVDKESLDQYAEWYAAGTDLLDPQLSPSFADLSGLPPLLVHVGADETLLDDAKAVATAAEAAGDDVTIEVWPDVFHAWHVAAGLAPESDDAVERVGRFLAGHVRTP